MTNEVNLHTLTTAEQQRMVTMLDHGAKSDIEIFCQVGELVRDDTGDHHIWFDISSIDDEPEIHDIVNHAIWWLEMRGKLLRDDSNRNLARVF